MSRLYRVFPLALWLRGVLSGSLGRGWTLIMLLTLALAGLVDIAIWNLAAVPNLPGAQPIANIGSAAIFLVVAWAVGRLVGILAIVVGLVALALGLTTTVHVLDMALPLSQLVIYGIVLLFIGSAISAHED